MACSQIVEHLSKAESEEEWFPKIILNNIQKIFEISFSNNLMIKLAVAHWIGQCATDLQPSFQETYGKKFLKLLRIYIDNDNEIIKAHSLAAVTNLAEESKDIEEITDEKEILLEMVEMSIGYLEKSTLIMLRENSLALVGSVAECLTKQFVPMLEKSVIVIQDVLHNADGDDYQQMKGQCYETLSIISAHLQEDFKPYIHKLVNILLNEPQENITNIHSNFRCYWIDGIRRLINIKNKEVLEEDQEKFSKLVTKTYDFYQKLVDQLEYVENEYENEVKLLGKAENDNGESEEEGEEYEEEEDEIAAAAGGNTKKNQLEEDENEGEEEDESRIDFKTYAENIIAVLKVTTVGLEDFPELFKEQAQSFILTKIFDLLQKSTFMQEQSEAILETLGYLLEIYKEKYSDLFTESTIDKYIEQLNELFYDDARQNIVELDSGKGGDVLQNYLVVFEELIHNCRFPIKKETAQTIIEKIIDLPLNQIQIKMISEFKIAKEQEEKNYFQSILEEVDVCQMQIIENLGAFLKNAQSYESQSLQDYLFNQPYKSKVSTCVNLYEQTKYSSFARFAACYCCDLIDYYPQCTEINLVLTMLINLSVVEELKTMQATAYGYGIAFKNLDISQEDQEKLLEILFKMHKNAKPTKSKKQVQFMYTRDNILSALYKSILDNKSFSKLQNPQEKFEKILELGQFVKDKDEILNILKNFIKQVENPEMVKLINGENNKNTETFLSNISKSLLIITEKENDVLKKNEDIGNQVFEACKKLIKDIEKDQQQKLYEKLLH
ncbi:Armadillo-type fold [Pseudocohnilembus persalinus]|uniref:Armadillo-type fold n=1 Tax=Pseudocohnilembus persalinus TaxID=266149 RepID=A0A0V0R811_PSEPJ|nr:Armadillo-type fold [Pseudocohnilembus persalinus]|eukprot:KRX10610.1 Armadillo-type fold [Pseudocohnilembus persalinus]